MYVYVVLFALNQTLHTAISVYIKKNFANQFSVEYFKYTTFDFNGNQLSRSKQIGRFMYRYAFSALTLLVGRQDERPACKKHEWSGAGMVICLE